MDEYYELRYKSSPGKVSYVLHKSENNLDIVGSSLSPKKIGIKLNEKGNICMPKYFLPPFQMDRKAAFEIISKKKISEIEKLVEKI